MKTTQEIYEAMLETVAERSGFSPDDSCDLAVRLYAAAAQLESLYAYADWSRQQCFPQTAVGEYLDLHAACHRVSRAAAAAARGYVTIYLPEELPLDVPVSAGTRFAVPDGPTFHLTQDCTIEAGSLSAQVEAECDVTGHEGNVAAGEICALVEAPSYVSAVNNLSAFTGGAEEESDEHLRLRVLEACRRIPNGANAAYYEAVALEQPGITSAVAIPSYFGDGTVALCISGDYDSPTALQQAAVRTALAPRTELGVTLAVIPPIPQTVNVALSVWPVDGVRASDAVAAAREAIMDYFDRPMLQRGVYLAQLGSQVYNTGLVKNFHFTSPTADSAPDAQKLYLLGTLTVTEGSE